MADLVVRITVTYISIYLKRSWIAIMKTVCCALPEVSDDTGNNQKEYRAHQNKPNIHKEVIPLWSGSLSFRGGQLARDISLVSLPVIAYATGWHAWLIVVQIVIIRGFGIRGSPGNSLALCCGTGTPFCHGILLHGCCLPFLTLLLSCASNSR